MFKKIPHTYTIVFSIIVFSALLTWFVPGGKFDRENITVSGSEKKVIVKDSYKSSENIGQTWQIFTAMYKGFEDKAGIIVFIFMVGGAFYIISETKSIDVGIYSFLNSVKSIKNNRLLDFLGVDNIIITMVMLLFSTFGAVFGMSEETIPFVMIIIPLAISMGYDSIVGVSMVFLAAGLGFAGALLNPFTVGIAQGIAGIPIFSGIEYRLFCWVIINIFGIAFVLRYAGKIKKNPKKSFVFKEDEFWRQKNYSDSINTKEKSGMSAKITFILIIISLLVFSIQYFQTTFEIGNSSFTVPILPVLSGFYLLWGFFSLRKSVHFFILSIFGFSNIILIVGVMGYDWYIEEIAGLFFAMGIAGGFAKGFESDKIVNSFLSGAKDIASAAIIVGFAAGIIKILEDGNIIDTLLFHASESIKGFGKPVSISIMYFFQTAINLFIPSGSGQAALTMPLMSPLSELIGIPKQAAVMAFQFGDGFTNMITPTSGVTIGVLGVAKIPYQKWFKFLFPFILVIIIVALLLLIPTVTMDLPGF